MNCTNTNPKFARVVQYTGEVPALGPPPGVDSIPQIYNHCLVKKALKLNAGGRTCKCASYILASDKDEHYQNPYWTFYSQLRMPNILQNVERTALLDVLYCSVQYFTILYCPVLYILYCPVLYILYKREPYDISRPPIMMQNMLTVPLAEVEAEQKLKGLKRSGSTDCITTVVQIFS
jgi:hypothetical protein